MGNILEFRTLNKEIEEENIAGYYDKANNWAYGPARNGHQACFEHCKKDLVPLFWESFPVELFGAHCMGLGCLEPLVDFSEEKASRIAIDHVVTLQKESMRLLVECDELEESEEMDSEAEELLQGLLKSGIAFQEENGEINVYRSGVVWLQKRKGIWF